MPVDLEFMNAQSSGECWPGGRAQYAIWRLGADISGLARSPAVANRCKALGKRYQQDKIDDTGTYAKEY